MIPLVACDSHSGVQKGVLAPLILLMLHFYAHALAEKDKRQTKNRILLVVYCVNQLTLINQRKSRKTT